MAVFRVPLHNVTGADMEKRFVFTAYQKPGALSYFMNRVNKKIVSDTCFYDTRTSVTESGGVFVCEEHGTTARGNEYIKLKYVIPEV